MMELTNLDSKSIPKPKIAVKVSPPSFHFISSSIILYIYISLHGFFFNKKSKHKRMGSLSCLIFFIIIILPTITASTILFQVLHVYIIISLFPPHVSSCVYVMIILVGLECKGFNWESSKKGGWYNSLIKSIPELSAAGITHVWIPPPSQSVSPEGKTSIHFVYYIVLLCFEFDHNSTICPSYPFTT